MCIRDRWSDGFTTGSTTFRHPQNPGEVVRAVMTTMSCCVSGRHAKWQSTVSSHDLDYVQQRLVSVQVDMMTFWKVDIEVYKAILHDQHAFIDSLSYLCTRVKHAQNASKSTNPVRVYLCQQPAFRAAATYQDIRAALHGRVAKSCNPTLTLFGLITSVSSPISTLFGFQQQCNACGCEPRRETLHQNSSS